jgi:hypothetical protein
MNQLEELKAKLQRDLDTVNRCLELIQDKPTPPTVAVPPKAAKPRRTSAPAKVSPITGEINQRVLAAAAKLTEPFTVVELAQAMGSATRQVGNAMTRMKRKGAVAKVGGQTWKVVTKPHAAVANHYTEFRKEVPVPAKAD